MALTAAQRKLYSSNPANEVGLDTLEISHPGFDQTYYFVNRATVFDATLETSSPVSFQPLGFAIVLPEKGSAQQDVILTLDGVSGLMIQQIEKAIDIDTSPIIVKYRLYIDIYPDTPQTNPPLDLEMSNVKATFTTVTGTVSRPDLVSRTFPRRVYTPSDFPGLQRG